MILWQVLNVTDYVISSQGLRPTKINLCWCQIKHRKREFPSVSEVRLIKVNNILVTRKTKKVETLLGLFITSWHFWVPMNKKRRWELFHIPKKLNCFDIKRHKYTLRWLWRQHNSNNNNAKSTSYIQLFSWLRTQNTKMIA